MFLSKLTQQLSVFKRRGKAALASAVALSTMLGACSHTSQQAYDAARPSAQPIRTQTSFSDSLACMDDMFLAYGIRDIRLTTKGIPDATGEIQTGTRDMLMSAVSRMSAKSRAFTFIDFEETSGGFGLPADRRFYERQQNLLTPQYYIRGAVTTFDEGVISDTFGVGVRVQGSGAGFNMYSSSSLVGLDMNVGETATGLIVPGIAAQNRIAVTRRSKGADASFDLKVDGEKVAGFLQAARSKSEGMHTAVRTLVEINTIETLGKLTRVPYWRCLGLEQTDPRAAKEAQTYFGRMTVAQQVEFVQRSLTGLGMFNGPVDGRMTPALSDAIGQYQAGSGLVANGRVDLQLYLSLLGKDVRLSPAGEEFAGSGQNYAQVSKSQLYISLSDRLNFPTFKVGMPLQVTARLNDNAYLYCFYQDGAGTISRIFPNRFQPNALVAGATLITVPSDEAGFRIVFESPGVTERVACFASRRELGPALPAALRQADLAPLQVRSLTELETAVRGLGVEDLAVGKVDFLVR